MILEMQDNPFHQDQDLLNHASQPDHQLAIRALLGDNRELFLQILLKHRTALFNLTPQAVIAESLDIEERQAKLKFSKLFNLKFSQVLLASQDKGRFFEKPEQLVLHKYAKCQYFEDRSKLKCDQSIVQAYNYIFTNITHIEDFIYFIDLASTSVAREPFQLVQIKSKEFLEGNIDKNLKIFDILANGNQEDQLIIKYCFCIVVTNLLKKQKNPAVDSITEDIQNKLKNQPLKKLLKACLYLCPLNFIDDVLERHPRELIEFDFKNNQCRLNSQYLHPELCGYDTFQQYFKKMNSLEQLIQKCQVISRSAKLQDNKVLLGINYQLLAYEQDDLYSKYSYSKKISSKTISEFADFINQLSTHISKEFVAIRQERGGQKYYNIMYACKAFETFVVLNRLKNLRSEHPLFEQIIINWGRHFLKWFDIQEIKNQSYLKSALKSYFSLINYIEKNVEFPAIANFQSQVSKTLFQLLVKVQNYPCELACFRGIKTIVFRWSLQNLPDTPQLKSIINKLVTCYFSDDLVLRSVFQFKDDLFQTPAMCKVVKKYLSVQIIEYVTRRYQRIQSQKINSFSHPSAKLHTLFFSKIGHIISSKILGETIQQFSALVMRYYLNYAHVWPLLHSFRLWLLQVCREPFDIKYDYKIMIVNELWDKFYAQVQKETKQITELDWSKLSKAAVQWFNQFCHATNIHINGLRLKRNKDIINKQTYWKHFQLLLDMQEKLNKLKNFNQLNESCISQWINQGFSIQKQVYSIYQQLKLTIRYFVCNSLRFLHIQQQESIMNCVGMLIIRTVESPVNENSERIWKFICQILGLSDKKYKSHISSRQIMGPLQRYTAKLNSKLQDFISFNFVSALYASIRPKYKDILRYILISLKEREDQQQLWLIIQKLMFPGVLISGSCIFNGQVHEKAKEDMALGLYYDQFQKVTDLLADGQNLAENVKSIVMLEKKKKIFSRFFEIIRTKSSKIVEKTRPNPAQFRYRSRNMSPEDVINAMAQMGVTRDEAEIALQNIEYPDQNLAMEWIDNNQDRLQELIVNRMMERTRQQNSRSQPKKDPELPQNQILPLVFQKFYEKEKLIKLSKAWIKIVFKELFKEQNIKQNQTLKDLMFLFMDSLKSDQSQKQYKNLNEKIYLEIDQLNKQQTISNKLILFLSILEGSFAKTQKARVDFYKNSINLKILSYLPRIQNEEIITKIFSLTNTTLPIFNNSDVLTPELQNYLSFLLDLVLRYRSNHKSLSQIMLKIAKSGKQALMQRITRNLTIFFKQKLIKQNIFSLINMIFQSDKDFSRVNAQLDLKTFLYQRYKHRIATFLPDKEHVLQIDIKQYQVSFQKYDKGSAIYDVSKEMLSKKKNKNRYFFYDCRKDKNAFDYSHYGKCSFLKYPIKQHFKTMIRSLLASLYEAKDQQVQEEVLTDLYKLLYNYRILLPFAVYQQVQKTKLIDWLLFSQNNCKRKFKFLTFLTLNVNLFIHIDLYNFTSLSDYICAKIIASVIKSSENTLWTSFCILNLSQVRKFTQFCQASLSIQNQINLIQHYQRLLQRAEPLEYVTISQFLYIAYKKRIIDNLRKKYKFAASQFQSSFDRQFLNVSPFFNALSIKKIRNERQQSQIAEMMQEEMDEQDEDSPQMMFFEEQNRRLLQRRNNFINQIQVQVQNLIVPIQENGKQNKEKEGNKQGQKQVQKKEQVIEPLVLKNTEYIEDILVRFEKYLCFDEEVATNFNIKQATLPQAAIILVNFSNGFKINVQEVYLDIDLKIKKLTNFQNRIAEIYTLINPQGVWEVKKKEVPEDRQAFISLGRRLIENLNNPNGLEHNRQTLLTLQRLMQGRYSNRQQAANNQPPQRTINVNDIYQHMEEFAQPIRPVVESEPPKAQPMVIEQAPKQNQENKNLPEGHIQQEAPHIEPAAEILEVPQVQQLIQVPHSGSQNIPVPQIAELPPNIDQQVNDNPQALVNDVALANLNLQQPVEIPAQIVSQPAQNNDANIENPPIVPVLLVEANQPPQQPDQAVQIPVVPVVPVVPQVPQPPARQRQILTIFNLPQTFLRDVGLDEQFFDSLPQDLQQQQLMQFMAQQGANLNNNRRNSNTNPNAPVVDQQTQNMAFIQSLDPQTRAQILIEATPQFLATLPVNIREEAQRYRHLQVNRMMEEQQIQEERNNYGNNNNGNNPKGKAPLIYPVVKKEEFSKISDEAARAIFRGVFNIYPKLKLSAVKILLQNKYTQQKALATIIALINYLQADDQQVRRIKINRIDIVSKQHKLVAIQNWSNEQINHVRTYLLHIILQHIKIPMYKDEEFLMSKIGKEVYCEELAQFIQNQESIDPIVQLASFALNFYPDLATELMKKAKTLPDQLFERIVEGIRKEVWPADFYESLGNFSENQTLKEIFSKQFQSKPPKIQVLGRLLKYKFAHLPSLKKIHQDALEYYSTAYLQFLNQIFSIYTTQTLHQIQPLLIKHKQIHFQVIKYLLQNGKEIEKEPIGIILKKPHLLDFETKKFIFRSHPKLRKLSGRRVHIEVDRTHLFQGSYNQLMTRTVRELQGKIQVSFINEPGYDAGGLKRQWFLLVSRQIFNQNYALFQKSSSGSTYQPNPKSYINPDHLNYFKFIGRFIAKSLIERELIDAYFTRAFYKMIIGQQLEFNDLQAQDYEFYKSMEWLKNNNIDEGIFTFSYIYDNFGNRIEKELVPGGKDIIVSEQNKMEYIEKYCMAKMRDDFSTQINKFLQGFYEVIPQECISYFQAKQIELLISGVPEVDIEDMKKNTDYSGYNPADQIIVWFWEVVTEYSQQDLAKLVQFITGTSKIPVQGFSHMIGMNGIQRISIHKDPCEHQLPKSHTCFNQLDLPNYATKEILKQKLGICLAWGSEGFGFM